MKQVSKLLNEVKFNPRAPGVMNIIANAGNPSYFETRALEFITEAAYTRNVLFDLTGLIALNHPETAEKDKEKFIKVQETYKEELIAAIKMLTIAILKVEDGEF